MAERRSLLQQLQTQWNDFRYRFSEKQELRDNIEEFSKESTNFPHVTLGDFQGQMQTQDASTLKTLQNALRQNSGDMAHSSYHVNALFHDKYKIRTRKFLDARAEGDSGAHAWVGYHDMHISTAVNIANEIDKHSNHPTADKKALAAQLMQLDLHTNSRPHPALILSLIDANTDIAANGDETLSKIWEKIPHAIPEAAFEDESLAPKLVNFFERRGIHLSDTLLAGQNIEAQAINTPAPLLKAMFDQLDERGLSTDFVEKFVHQRAAPEMVASLAERPSFSNPMAQGQYEATRDQKLDFYLPTLRTMHEEGGQGSLIFSKIMENFDNISETAQGYFHNFIDQGLKSSIIQPGQFSAEHALKLHSAALDLNKYEFAAAGRIFNGQSDFEQLKNLTANAPEHMPVAPIFQNADPNFIAGLAQDQHRAFASPSERNHLLKPLALADLSDKEWIQTLEGGQFDNMELSAIHKHAILQENPNIPRVFENTGIEVPDYSQRKRHLKFERQP